MSPRIPSTHGDSWAYMSWSVEVVAMSDAPDPTPQPQVDPVIPIVTDVPTGEPSPVPDEDPPE